MIGKQITDKIVVVGTSPDGRGGVASVIASHRRMMETFNFIKIHIDSPLKFVLPLTGIIKSLRFVPHRYKVVHIHSSSYSDFYRCSIFVIFFKALGKKVILHMHGANFDGFYGEGRAYVRKIFRMSDEVLAVSSYYADFMRSHRLNDNVRCLHNGIAGRGQDAASAPSRVDGVTNLSYFGAIDDRKGVFDVLEAIGEERDYFAGKIRFRIGGIGNLQKFNSIIEKYGLHDIVEYLGWIDPAGKERLLESTDVFVHPSRSESFGISILEAMDFGLPIITTNVGGIPDLVSDGINGIVVAPGDKQRIREAIIKLINDPSLRGELGANSKLAAKKFYFPFIERQLKDVYQSLL